MAKKKTKRAARSAAASSAQDQNATPPTASEPAGSQGAVVTTWRQRLLLIAFGLVLFALGLALLEGTLAVFGIGDAARYQDPFVGFAPGQDLFEKKTLENGRVVYATRPEKLAFFNAQLFPADTADDAYRIFALGGSTTAGRPYDDEVAFARWLELYLDALDPSRDWQAINAGAISYASYRVVLVMKELVRYQPDLFVVYTGHNEFLEERSYADIIHQNPVLKRLRFWLNSRRFFALARDAWLGQRAGDPADDSTSDGASDSASEGALAEEVETRLDGWTGLETYRRDAELRSSILEHYAFNLRQMVQIARDHDVDLVFVDPVSNLKDFSPFKSEPPLDASADKTAALEQHLAAGRSRLAANDPAGALVELEQGLALDPEYADLHYLVARAHFAAEDFDAAHAAFERARDFDVAPLRAVSEISSQLREITQREGIPLIDLPALLAADSRQRYGHAILGNEYLLDHVHPDIATHGLIAEQVIELLAERGVAQPAADWTPAKRRALYESVVGEIDRAYYAERDLNLSKVLGWAGKLAEAEVPLRRAAEVLDKHPEVALNLGVIYQKTGRYQEAARELERAARLDPGSPEAHFNLGVVYGHLDRLAEGTDALRSAIRLRPDYPEAFYNLGVLLSRQGSFDEALTAFEKTLELKPDASEVEGQLALVYRGLGRFDKAIATLERQLEAEPENAATRTALGITYGRQGRLDDAVRELERVTATEPSFAEAHYNLGVVHSQRGDEDRAVAAFKATIEAEPDHVEARNNLGIYHAGRGELETARQYLVRALEIDPDYADAYFNLGIVFDNAGRPEEASRALERAVELAPDNPRFNFALAMMHFALGRTDSARRHFETARAGGIATPPEIQQQLGGL
ncbi:MAG: tetratricopeptide repeat protein [Acidobacteriota bacterium]